MTIKNTILAALAALFVGVFVSACSSEESAMPAKAVEEVALSPEQSLVKNAAGKAPQSVAVYESTAYMSVIFDGAPSSNDFAQLVAKRLMPVLLAEYPNINRFFIGWAIDKRQVTKIQFEREQVEGVNWDRLSIKNGDVKRLTSMFWLSPEYR